MIFSNPQVRWASTYQHQTRFNGGALSLAKDIPIGSGASETQPLPSSDTLTRSKR